MPKLFLGLDSSTQSLSAVVIDLDAKNAAANCHAIFEAQMLSMRLHSQWMNVVPERVFATGGAAKDAALLQVMADVMKCRVLRIEVSKSVALGAALQAAYGWINVAGKNPKWEKLGAGFRQREPQSHTRLRQAAGEIRRLRTRGAVKRSLAPFRTRFQNRID